MPIEEVQPHAHDIKCGRGHGSNMHPGNRYYQDKVMANKQSYKESRGNFDKNMIAGSILNDIQSRSPPGRFLESHVSNGKEIWTIIMDQDIVIKKIKQALRDKHLRRKEASSSLLSQSTASTTCSTITSSSIPSSPPILIATTNYGGAMMHDSLQEESKQIEEYINNNSTPTPNSYVPMPPLSSTTATATAPVQLQQESPSRDFSSTQHHNPYGYYSDSLSTGKCEDYQANYGLEQCTSSNMAEVATRGSEALSLSLRSSDMQLLRESLRSVEMRDSLRSIDMDIDGFLFE